jgi:co-chaperonin GroES (HSP10)
MAQDAVNNIEFGYTGLGEAFPACDPGVVPFGSRVLLQIRSPKKKTKGGIILLDETKDTEYANTQVAKVIAVGELAFRNRTTMDPWPEGSWCQPGEFVRIPRYGGDRWSVKPLLDGNTIPSTEDRPDEAILVIFNDLDLVGKVTGDPLAIKAFL